MQQAAKVIKMTGYGTDALRQAITDGIINGEVLNQCQAVLNENENLKHEVNRLKRELLVYQTLERRNRDAAMDAIRAAVEAEQNKDFRYVFICLGILILTLIVTW